jgi:DNA-binding NarL/FixJ family response regulator
VLSGVIDALLTAITTCCAGNQVKVNPITVSQTASGRARRLPATKPPKLSPDRRQQQQLRRLAATGEPVHELAKALGISRATAYRYLSQVDDLVRKTSRNLPICTSSLLISTVESTG